MNIADVVGRTLTEICRALKVRRAGDGYSYRTHHAGQNDPTDPSTWNLPVYHCPVWLARSSIIRYLIAFARYVDVLSQFGVAPDTILVEGGAIFEE